MTWLTVVEYRCGISVTDDQDMAIMTWLTVVEYL